MVCQHFVSSNEMSFTELMNKLWIISNLACDIEYDVECSLQIKLSCTAFVKKLKLQQLMTLQLKQVSITIAEHTEWMLFLKDFQHLLVRLVGKDILRKYSFL